MRCPLLEARRVAARRSRGRPRPMRAAARRSPGSSARSPLTRIGRCRSASAVPEPTQPRGVCGFRNVTSPASRSGLTEMILAPLRFAVSSAVSIRGWLVPGFCPAITISSAMWMSCSDTEPLPIPMVSASATEVDSWHMFEQSGQVVGAERADEQLVDERRLVGGLARGVEHRLVRRGQAAQVAADQRERLVPVDRLVVGAAGAQHHRLGDPALLAEPVVGLLAELGDRVVAEELPVELPPGGLLGDRLGAVLAELGGGRCAGLGVRPGAALAVEPVDLVELAQRRVARRTPICSTARFMATATA